MGKVIYVFPALGKTTYCKNHPNCIELSSEKYHWLDEFDYEEGKGNYKNINPLWPQNYLDAIIENVNKYDYVFVTNSGRELCKKNNIEIYAIYPSINSKNEIINRMTARNNSNKVILNMKDNFEKYVSSIIEDDYFKEKIELNNFQYLSDGIELLNQLTTSPLKNDFVNDIPVITTDTNSNSYKKLTKSICNDNNITKALIIFEKDYIQRLNLEKNIVGRFYSGEYFSNIALMENFAIVNSFLGSANAAGLMEELIYYGISNIFAIGGGGSLYNSDSPYILIERAIRDEGTSLAYQKESLYSLTSRKQNENIAAILEELNVNYKKGITWSTDAFYREGNKKTEKMKELGASCVDMETSTWCSVADFYKINFSILLRLRDYNLNGMWIKEHLNREELTDLGIKIIRKTKEYKL